MINSKKESYINGFCKVAESNGYNPFELARLALGFQRLKTAETRAFVQDLFKKAAYSRSRRPLQASNLRRATQPQGRTPRPGELVSPNLRKPSPAPSGQGASSVPAAPKVPGLPTVLPTQPVQSPKAKSQGQQPNATEKALAKTQSPADRRYEAFSNKAKKNGWNYSNGTWISPSGQKFTDSQVNSRIRLRSLEKAINRRAEARRAAGIPLPQKTHVPQSNGILNRSYGVNWRKKWSNDDLLNFDTKAFRRNADTWAERSRQNRTTGLGTFTFPI